MLRNALIRGAAGSLFLGLFASAACSSSDDAGPGSQAGAGTGGAPAPHAGSSNAGAIEAGSEQGGTAQGGTEQGGADQGGTEPGGSGEAGGAAAGAAGSGTAGTGPEAGSGGEGGGDSCAACASGICLPGGECVECLPSNDHCPSGQYCTSSNTCSAGCKDASSCASGVCEPDHSCQSCISDSECSAQTVCGAQQCAAACTTAQEGGNLGCGAGLTCCSLHCVDTGADNQHCGACGTACSAATFCGRMGCTPIQVSSLCQIGKVTVLLDKQQDDAAGQSIAQSLLTTCVPAPTTRSVAQTVYDAINASNGRPVAGGDELLVVAGGFAVQSASNYVITQGIAPLIHGQNGARYEITNAGTGTVIASELSTEATSSHDLFAIEVMREPSSGSLILNAFGFTPGGTAAAASYFDQLVTSGVGLAIKAWYVGEWTDTNNDGVPGPTELSLIDSGG